MSISVHVRGSGPYEVVESDAPAPSGWVKMTVAQYGALLAAYSPPPHQAEPRRQSARVVLQRLTAAERAALRACTVPAIIDAYDIALIEGVIFEGDADFPAFRAALDQLGIIAAARWDALLA